MKTFMKTLPILLLALVCLLSFASCSGKDEKGKEEAPEELQNYDMKTVSKNACGFPAFRVVCDNERVVSAKAGASGVITLTSHNPGKAKLDVEDCFGHKASVNVTVADDENRTVSFECVKCTEDFINAYDFGVTSGSGKDCTAALQKAIDKAAETKSTVYLYPGIYTVSFLHIRDGVTLEMYSGFEDATLGFTSELSKMINTGRVTVLKETRIMNNDMTAYGHDGDSNFTIRGGVIDNGGSSQSILLFGLADNVRLENVVFKDIKGNHVIQFTGCSNVVVDNCIFAGFIDGGTFTREVIQLEQTSPGAHSSSDNPPQKFVVGEQIGNSNVEITNCYFGPSATAGPPLIAIGHHGYTRDPNCENLLIKGCVFDGCMYAGIRISNIVNGEITGCTFTTNSKYPNPYASSQTTPAEILIFSFDSSVTYTTTVDNKTKITLALKPELSGTHNLKITDNKFTLTEGTDKRVFEFLGTSYQPGLLCRTSALNRQDTYNGKIYQISGYLRSSNQIEGVTIKNNEINVDGVCAYKDYIMHFKNVTGLDYADNKISYAKGSLCSSKDFGVVGLYAQGTVQASDNESRTRYVSIEKTSKSLFLDTPNGKITVVGTASATLTLRTSGNGRIECGYDDKGVGTITAIPAEGYKFDGWSDGSNDLKTGNKVEIGTNRTIFAKFSKK